MESSALSPEEYADITRINDIRKNLINELITSGVPKGTADKVLLANLLDGTDRSVFTSAKLRNDKKAADNDSVVAKEIAEVLKAVRVSQYRNPATREERTLPEDRLKQSFVPGELHIGNEPVSIPHDIG